MTHDEFTAAELRERRRRLSLSQRRLADALGVATNTVARWERGDLTIRNPRLMRLALDHLAGGAAGQPADVGDPTVSGRFGVPYLPALAAPLVGRARLLGTARASLRDPSRRLLTLVGPGGSGKTHLALALAHAAANDFVDRARVVELADVDDSRLVAAVVARGFALRDITATSASEGLGAALAECDGLLVLDNCEHVLAAAATLVTELRQSAPHLTIIATSREALGSPGERCLDVPPLAVPDLNALPGPAALARVPAVAMFVDRWRESHADFKLTQPHIHAVAEICVRLDGLPLALELAASQPGNPSPANLLSRLSPALALSTRRRDIPSRHRSLRAAQEWSYGLLDQTRRAVFRHLGVFVGGFDEEAAAAITQGVVDGRPCVQGDLDALCACHLITAADHGRGARYRMLEPVRQYAVERLTIEKEDRPARARHAAFFTALAQANEPSLWDHRQLGALDTIERELPNIRSALAWCRSRHGDADLGLELAVAMRRYWDLRGPLQEAREHFEALLPSVPADRPARIQGLLAVGMEATRGGDVATTATLVGEALHLARRHHDKRSVSVALSGLSLVALFEGNSTGAALLAADAVREAEEAGDRWARANGLLMQGSAAAGAGNPDAAEGYVLDALAELRAQGDRWLGAEALIVLGNLRYDRGDTTGARQAYVQCLEPHFELANRIRLATTLQLIAVTDADTGELDRAAQLIGAADALVAGSTVPWPPMWNASCDAALDIMRKGLGEARFAEAVRSGNSLEVNAAILLAAELSDPEPAIAPPRALGETRAVKPLTPREEQVAALIAKGRTNLQIAEILSITRRTANTHVEHIMVKLGVHSRAEVAAWVQRSGIP